jgi:hypothetical protein
VSAAAALDWAETAAMLGDYSEAVMWLDYSASISGSGRPEFAERRALWAERAAAVSSR